MDILWLILRRKGSRILVHLIILLKTEKVVNVMRLKMEKVVNVMRLLHGKKMKLVVLWPEQHHLKIFKEMKRINFALTQFCYVPRQFQPGLFLKLHKDWLFNVPNHEFISLYLNQTVNQLIVLTKVINTKIY